MKRKGSQSFVISCLILIVLLLVTAVFASSDLTQTTGAPGSDPLPSNTFPRAAVSGENGAQAVRTANQPSVSTGSYNIDFVSQFGGPVSAVAIQGNHAYIGEGSRLTILNIMVRDRKTWNQLA